MLVPPPVVLPPLVSLPVVPAAGRAAAARPAGGVAVSSRDTGGVFARPDASASDGRRDEAARERWRRPGPHRRGDRAAGFDLSGFPRCRGDAGDSAARPPAPARRRGGLGRAAMGDGGAGGAGGPTAAADNVLVFPASGSILYC